MRIIGDLVFAGIAKIRNALLDPVVNDPVTPVESQIWYNTATKTLKFYDGAAVQTIAIGGSTSALAFEIDAIEAAVGLATNGSFVLPEGTNYLGTATSLLMLSVLLDTQIKVNSDSIANINTALSGQTAQLVAVQTEIDTTQNGVGLLSSGAYSAPGGSNYLGSTNSVINALLALDSSLKSVQDSDLTKVSTVTDSSINANVVFATGKTLTVPTVPSAANHVVRLIDLQNRQANLDIQADVLNIQFDNTFAPSLTEGARYIITDAANLHASFGVIVGLENNDIVEYRSGVFVVAYDVSLQGNGVLVWDRNNVNWMNFVNSWTPFGGLSGINPGIGLDKSGNTINVNVGAGLGTNGSDHLVVKVKSDGGLFNTEDGLSQSGSNAAELSIRVDGTSLQLTPNGVKVASSGINESHLHLSVVGDGLSGGGGNKLKVEAANGIKIDSNKVVADTAFFDTTYARKDGATFTGAVTVPAPSEANQAARRADVDVVTNRLTNSYMLYNGNISQSTHTIVHNLNMQYPVFIVYDANNKQIIPDEVIATDANTLTVSFSAALTCKVALFAPKV